jgi:hypothetical protein
LLQSFLLIVWICIVCDDYFMVQDFRNKVKAAFSLAIIADALVIASTLAVIFDATNRVPKLFVCFQCG